MSATTRADGPSEATPAPISLLWPHGSAPQAKAGTRLAPEAVADLDLAPVIQALCGAENRHERFVTEVLTTLCVDPQVLAYRAEALDDLLADEALREDLRAALPGLETLAQQARLRHDAGPVQRIVQRLGALDLFVDVVLLLRHALDRATPRAQAWQALRADVQALTETPHFAALQAELPALREQLTAARSVTIGVNLSDQLLPESATLLSLDAERIEGRPGLLERLLGREGGRAGLTPLRSGDAGTENVLLRDLRRLLERVVAPVGNTLDRYSMMQTRRFAGLGPELALLLGAAALIERVRRAGLPLCRPEIAPLEERVTRIEDGYNLSLALRMLDGAAGQGSLDGRVVTNSAAFDATGRVWILTGPNRGGKTTYTRAIGQTHALAQAGLYVPGRTARLSSVDAIYTHFPARESAAVGQGRLDDEAVRLAAIFQQATPHSLILLNEVLAGTSTVEALGLALDAVRGLHLLGARAIYVTHLHDLALRADEINAQTAGDGTVASVVADLDDEDARGGDQGAPRGNASGEAPRRTYRLRRGPPRGLSYASEIALQHGISFPQLKRLLHSRGLLAMEQHEDDAAPSPLPDHGA